MKLTEYLDGMSAATTARELEAAIQVPFDHPYVGPTWSRICKVRIQAGERICAAHPDGKFVPILGPRHLLMLAGQTYRVRYGQNSTGVRYAWEYARLWAFDVLKAEGFSGRACAAIWGCAFSYPHRSLENVVDALAGKLPDPRFNRLIPHRHTTAGPVRVDRETEAKSRSHRPCKCKGGWLWDWGSGWDGSATFINWHCDRCSRVYTEYVTNERLTEIRQRRARAA